MVKGFQQKNVVDFDEIIAMVVKMTSIRIAASMDLEIEQLDVKTAFLHADLEEEICVHQPEGVAKKGKENLVCRLRKSFMDLSKLLINGTKNLNSS